MIIKTKKYSLSPNTYIRMALWQTVKQQWWLIGLFALIAPLAWVLDANWPLVVSGLLITGYLVLYASQFYVLTTTEQAKLMFEKLYYEISGNGLMVLVSPRQGMPISWDQIAKVTLGKDYVCFFIANYQFFYLPFSIFSGPQEINMLKHLLARKNHL